MLHGGEQAATRIRAFAPGRLSVADLTGEFADELVADWGASVPNRDGAGLRTDVPGRISADEREALVRDADVMLLGMPFPKRLPERAPRLRWAHFAFAGVSNLMGSGWWGLEKTVLTSSRGYTGALPIAETALTGAFMLAKRLDRAAVGTAGRDFLDKGAFDGMIVLAGKTVGIVGLGGIGSHVARLAKGFGMRVVATRRSATERRQDVDGVDEVFPASAQNEMLAQCDIVVVCAMWTPETERMLGEDAFAVVKPGAIFVNIARGELVDEHALAAALRDGRLGGAYLDVWHHDIAGEPPIAELQDAPNVVFTPHVSFRGDESHAYGVDLFLENLGRFLADEPLENAIDWSRGY